MFYKKVSIILSSILFTALILTSTANAASGDVYDASYYELAKISSGGNKIWSVPGGIFESVAVGSDGSLYSANSAQGAVGSVTKRDPNSGVVLWTYVPGGSWPYVKSVAVNQNDGSVYSANNNSVSKINPIDGKEIWKTSTGSYSAYGIAINSNDGSVYVYSTAFGVTKLDGIDGHIIWSVGGGISLNGASGVNGISVNQKDGTIYVANYYGNTVNKLDPTDGHVIWSAPAIGAKSVDVYSKDGYVYVARQNVYQGPISQNIAKFDPIDGHQIWVLPASSNQYDAGKGISVDQLDGSIYFSHQGFSKLDPTDGHVIWKASGIGGYPTGSAVERPFISNNAKVPGTPTSVSAVAGNAQATITFSAPVSNGGSPITSYIVTSNPDNIIKTGSASPIIITGLTSGTSYTFTVKAVNAIGTGPASSASNSVIPVAPITIPSAPTAVSAVAGNAQATITFSAPVSNGGSAITGYTVTSNPVGGVDTNAETTDLTHTVAGLINGTPYTFTVVATNIVGNSPVSEVSNFIIPDDADGIDKEIDRNKSTGVDEGSVYSNDFNDGSTFGTIVDRGGWNVSVTDLVDGGVQIKIDGAGTGIAKIVSCNNYVETQLDAAGETINLICGSTNVTAVVANPRIIVREPGSDIRGKAIKVSLGTGQSVKMGSYVIAGETNTEPIFVEILDENEVVLGSGSLTPSQNIDIVLQSENNTVLIENQGTTPVTFVMDNAALNLVPGEKFNDLCPNSIVDTNPLPNSYSWTGGANFMTTDPKTKQLVDSSYSMVQTNGCSCAQILAGTVGQEKGQLKSGCTKETLETYINNTHKVSVWSLIVKFASVLFAFFK